MAALCNSNSLMSEDFQIGDLIEFLRGPYSHWGVYIGDGKIVHLAGVDNDGVDADIKVEHVFTICGIRFNKAKVCVDDLKKVAGGCKARKNNRKDKKYKPLDQYEIKKKALEKLGEVGYNLVYSNCEHFASWCRYGISKSDQVDNVLTGTAVGLATALTAGVIYAFATFWKNDKEKKEEEEEEENAISA